MGRKRNRRKYFREQMISEPSDSTHGIQHQKRDIEKLETAKTGSRIAADEIENSNFKLKLRRFYHFFVRLSTCNLCFLIFGDWSTWQTNITFATVQLSTTLNDLISSRISDFLLVFHISMSISNRGDEISNVK